VVRHAQGFVVVLLTLGFVLTGVGAVGAQGPMGFGERGSGGGLGEGLRLPLILRGAHLTPDQQTRVRDILTAHRAGMRTLTEQLRQAQEAMTDKLFAPGPVQAADLQPSVQRIAQLRTQLLQESSQIVLEVRALLAPEQLAQAAQVKDRLKALTAEMRQLLPEGRP
jgi:Spy/CpxP family protein refolding chaperone